MSESSFARFGQQIGRGQASTTGGRELPLAAATSRNQESAFGFPPRGKTPHVTMPCQQLFMLNEYSESLRIPRGVLSFLRVQG
jgi:hypothetical protein